MFLRKATKCKFSRRRSARCRKVHACTAGLLVVAMASRSIGCNSFAWTRLCHSSAPFEMDSLAKESCFRMRTSVWRRARSSIDIFAEIPESRFMAKSRPNPAFVAARSLRPRTVKRRNQLLGGQVAPRHAIQKNANKGSPTSVPKTMVSISRVSKDSSKLSKANSRIIDRKIGLTRITK